MTHYARLLARQDRVAAAPSDILGVSGGTTLGQATPTDGAFVVDNSVAPGLTQQSAPPLAENFTPVITETTETAPTTSASAAAGATHSISLGTVIGACVGAFIGACLIILFSVWFYRRSNRSLKAQARRGDPSRQNENWKQIKDDEDKWGGGMTEISPDKSSLSRSPTEKIGVFKKSPSMRTNGTSDSKDSKSTAMPAFDPLTFAPYHPNLALELAGAAPANGNHAQGDGDSQAASWKGDHSLLTSLRSERAASGSLSPSLTRSMSTPVMVTAADAHHWQSAEVVTVEGSAASIEVDRQSEHDNPVNPFFSSKEREYMMRAKEHSKGKRRNDDPFVDNVEITTPHNDAAIQSLLAALDTPPSPMSPLVSSPTESTDGAQYIRPLPSPPQA